MKKIKVLSVFYFLLHLSFINAQPYSLIINNGSGSGDYAENEQVQIIATPAVSDSVFDYWIGDINYLDDEQNDTTTVTMPALDISFTAIYRETVAPTAPTGLAASDAGFNSVTLDWNPSTDNIGVKEYQVFQDGTLGGTSTDTFYTAASLAPGTDYLFKVRAKDEAGNVSAFSDEITVSTPSSGPTDYYETLDNMPDGFYHDGSFVGDNGNTWEYYDCMKSTSSDIRIQKSNGIFKTTMEDGLSSLTIENAYGYNDNPSKIKLFVNNISQGFIEIGTTPANYTWDNIPATGTVEIKLGGVANQHCVVENISWTSSNGDIEPPSIPSNLSASSVTDRSCKLKWEKSIDDIAVKGYILYQNFDSLTFVTDTSFTVRYLSTNTNYHFNVKAIDYEDKLSESSDTLQITTLEELPVPPVKILIFAGQSNMSGSCSYNDINNLDSQAAEWTNDGNNDSKMYTEDSQAWVNLSTKRRMTHVTAYYINEYWKAINPEQKVYIIHLSHGATNMSGHWQAGGRFNKSQGDGNIALKQVISDALSTIGEPYEVEAFFWYQGEGDCCPQCDMKQSSPFYETYLRDMIDGWDENVFNETDNKEKYSGSIAELTGYYNMVSIPVRVSWNIDGWPDRPTWEPNLINVRTAIENYANKRERSDWVDIDDIPLADNFHYKGDGYVEIGYRMAQKYLGVVQDEEFQLTVNNGSGSGRYAAGADVTISANPAIEGEIFSHWVGDNHVLSDSLQANNTFSMPSSDITLNAVYKDIQDMLFCLTFSVSDGTSQIPGASIYTLNDTLLSDESGIAIIDSILFDTLIEYEIVKESFNTIKESITIKRDTTINIVLNLINNKREINQNKLMVYPNPFLEQLNINNLPSNSTVYLMNLAGKVILQQSAKSSFSQIEAGHLKSGIYIIQIRKNNGQILNERVVIKN